MQIDDPEVAFRLLPRNMQDEILKSSDTEAKRLDAMQSYYNSRLALLPKGVQDSVLRASTTEDRMKALFAAFETGNYDEFGDMEMES